MKVRSFNTVGKICEIVTKFDLLKDTNVKTNDHVRCSAHLAVKSVVINMQRPVRLSK